MKRKRSKPEPPSNPAAEKALFSAQKRAVIRLMKAHHEAVKAHHASERNTREFFNTWAVEKEARWVLDQFRRECQTHFAQARGWRYSPRDFSLRMLRERRSTKRRYDPDYLEPGGLIDHPEFYRHVQRPYLPAALLTHSYHPVADVLAYVAEQGLVAEVLPWSWYYPDYCCAVLITPRP